MSSKFPLDRRLEKPQSPSGRGGEEKKYTLLPLPGIKLQPVALSILTEIHRLLGMKKKKKKKKIISHLNYFDTP